MGVVDPTTRHPVATKIQNHFVGPNGQWLVVKEVQREANLLAEAQAAIDELHADCLEMETSINNELAEERQRLNDLSAEWQKKNLKAKKELTNLRMAAKSLITQLDKALETA